MPQLPIPADLVEFLEQPNPLVMATVRPDGQPHCVPCWYDWEDGRALLSMDAARVRLAYIRRDPRVALSVLGRESWLKHVSLVGRIVEMYTDTDLADIDRLAYRYMGMAYYDRERPRVSAWFEPELWHEFDPMKIASEEPARG